MKLCNHEGCKYKQFGGGFCKFHQRERPKTKKINNNLHKRKRGNSLKRNISKRREKTELKKGDKELWNAIWAERPHIDFETGEPIYGEPLTLYFHHVLPKNEGPGGYPQFRYKKWNIVLVSWDTHAKAEADLDLVPKIKAYRNKLLKTKVK